MPVIEKKHQLERKQLKFSHFHYKRRVTRAVLVGSVGVGGKNPLRLQSMTTTPTMDTQATVEQVRRLADVGCEIARITAPTVREAQNLGAIKNELIKQKCLIPLVADIHFRPDAALVAADFVEKVRVNPGNFSDGKAFKEREYTDLQYQDELNRLEDRFTPLVLKLKNLKRSLRIGTNHGSLSDRIMNRFGDTPLGMVESALEFVRICEKNDFHEVIFSMKASNPKVMIQAYRLLAQRLDQEGMNYPFHLGVTEAGDGQDGRLKSAVGIGSLLEDGIGDTIRVSLTEDPEKEIPVAHELAARYAGLPPEGDDFPKPSLNYVPDPLSFVRRETQITQSGPVSIGGTNPIRVLSRVELDAGAANRVMSLLEENLKKDTPLEILEIPYKKDGDFAASFQAFKNHLHHETQWLSTWVSFQEGQVPSNIDFQADGYLYRFGVSFNWTELNQLADKVRQDGGLLILAGQSVPALLYALERLPKNKAPFSLVVGLDSLSQSQHVHSSRYLAARLREIDSCVPLILFGNTAAPGWVPAVVQGSLVCDGLGDILSVSPAPIANASIQYAYNLLQACGSRVTKTEYVSCPSCGRTLFDLQTTTERIKSQTGHLKGVKIAIMGCIVNGPGEMADADFGYVGGGPGKINLYVGKNCVEKSIPSAIADEKLIQLIKDHGKWVEPR